MPVGRGNRRTFIAALGGAMAWPVVASAQQRTNAQTQKVYRIGFLFAGTIALRPQAQEFWRKLQELGYIEGNNLIYEIREAVEMLIAFLNLLPKSSIPIPM